MSAAGETRCEDCNGNGWVVTVGMWVRCGHCHATGVKPAQPTPAIGGREEIEEVKQDREEIRELANSAIQRNVGLILERDRLRAENARLTEEVGRLSQGLFALSPDNNPAMAGNAVDSALAWIERLTHERNEAVEGWAVAIQTHATHAAGIAAKVESSTIERAAKAVCEACAEGVPVQPRDITKIPGASVAWEHREIPAYGFQCDAWKIRALSPSSEEEK